MTAGGAPAARLAKAGLVLVVVIWVGGAIVIDAFALRASRQGDGRQWVKTVLQWRSTWKTR